MAKLLMLLWFGLSSCQKVDKPRQPSPAVEPTPTPTPFATATPTPTPTPTPYATATPLATATPTAAETPAAVIAAENDPRPAETDTAALPTVWVYFNRDDQRGYRSIFLFAHRQMVSDVRVSYTTLSLSQLTNSGYSNLLAEEKDIFVQKELQLRVSFLFGDQPHCGRVKIKADNIVPAGATMGKDKALTITPERGTC